MSDLIRREDAIKILSQRAEILRGAYGNLGGACSGALKIIKTIQSAEPERKKGKWVWRKDRDCHECSECKAVLEEDDIKTHNFYYCYHCGADMRTADGWVNIEN